MRVLFVWKKMGVSVLFLSVLLMAYGCTSIMRDSAQKQPDRYEEWRILAEDSKGSTPSPRKFKLETTKDKGGTLTRDGRSFIIEQQEKEAGSLPDEALDDPLPQVPVTMRMHEVPVAVLLRTLARAADVNIMINETVSGKAKININNVPWDQAFKGILNTYGLTYSYKNGVMRVITVEDLNNDIALMEAQQKYEKSMKGHKIAMMAMNSEEEQLEPLMTRIIKIDYADIVSLQKNLQTYLLASLIDSEKNKGEDQDDNPDSASMELRGSILVDENSSSLIIQATKADLNKIMPILEALDRPSEQILIEAHIVEANSDTAKELGIQWGGFGLNTAGGYNNMIGSAIESTADGTSVQPGTGDVINFPTSSSADSSSNGFTLGLMNENVGKNLLYVQLTALEEDGKLNILSKPSITTMDNRPALIESGKEVPFQTIEDDEVKIEWKKAVIKLDVTPHVINKNMLRLRINTSKDELDWTNTVLGNPTIITKNAETEVILYDGQTTVIGGLNKEKITEGEAGVPWLKDVKGLGQLFRNNNDATEMEELMIFITPHILKERQSTETGGSN